jgi:hypothetical protein
MHSERHVTVCLWKYEVKKCAESRKILYIASSLIATIVVAPSYK